MAQQIDIMQLPLEQLKSVGQQVEEDIQILTTSFTKLRDAQSKFNACIESLVPINKNNKGNLPIHTFDFKKDALILVPLTNSLYVPGHLKNPEKVYPIYYNNKVIVDVGTGYFVEKSTSDATLFYSKKVEFLKENLDKLAETINSKQDQLKVVLDVIQFKNKQPSQ